MHGPGLPPPHPVPGHLPPPPAPGVVMTLRVLFTALPLLSCGILAWAAMLRLALLTRTKRDWTLFGVSIVIMIGAFVFTNLDKTPDQSGWQTNVGIVPLLLLALGATIHYVIADVRHFTARAALHAGPAPVAAPWYPPQTPGTGYGYPPQAGPAYGPLPGSTPVPGHGHGTGRGAGHTTTPSAGHSPYRAPAPTPPPYAPPQPQPQHQPPAQHQPPPPRTARVRAELDELSELLRRETEGRAPAHDDRDPYRDPYREDPYGPGGHGGGAR
ncbi:hypothetical protein ACN20G_15700 [Streptomyces sp. BI20]|uniref:hypothetical protein n=1 Tax=Streptomyces sp. BI20 TaxID=3403460 RepID=UPI003C7795E8